MINKTKKDKQKQARTLKSQANKHAVYLQILRCEGAVFMYKFLYTKIQFTCYTS